MKSLRRGAAASLFGVLTCFSTGQVFADAVITDALREIRAELSDGSFVVDDDLTFNPYGPFIVSIGGPGTPTASASQTSSIDVLQFTGEGDADISGSTSDLLGALAESRYFVEFTLSASHAYSLSGELEEFLDGGSSLALFSLDGPGPDLLFSALGNDGPLNLASAGVLGPGTYELTVLARSEGNEESNYFVRTDWEFNLTLRDLQIPEPGTLALLLIALAGLTFSRRKTLVSKHA